MSGVRFVVPFGAEGAADRAARAFSLSLGRGPGSGLGVTIENLPGAGGLSGVRRANELARSGAATLLLGTPTTHVLLPARLGEGEAPDASLRPLLGLGSAPNVLLASPALGVRTLAELLDRARRMRLTYASAGAGQTIHLCTALLCRQAGIAMTHRPYDGGSATAYPDLVRGDVHVYFDSLLGCRDRIEQGEGIPLAVSAAERSALLPQVPTLIEAGFPDHSLEVWLGVFGAHLEDDARRAIGDLCLDARLASALRALGLAAGPLPGSELRAACDESAPRWLRALAAAAS